MLTGLPRDKVRVVQTTTGGGFGGKEEYPSMLAGHAVLLARKAGRAGEDGLRAPRGSGRHHQAPSVDRPPPHRPSPKDGTILAIDIDLRLDGGAYVTLSPVVLSRAAIHATGPYRAEAVRIRGRVMMTNTPPNGAFRGFGAPQSQFAAEVHMDRIAGELGLDPDRAAQQEPASAPATSRPPGRRSRTRSAAHEVLDRALARHALMVRSQKKKKRAHNNGDAGVKRGTGIACSSTAAASPAAARSGSPRAPASRSPHDGVRLLVGSTEIGQGTRTMHAQIVAETLGIPYDWVETTDPDTARVPDSGPTVASRTCMVVGKILQRAAAQAARRARRLRRRRRASASARAGCSPSAAPVEIIEEYEKPGDIVWSDETYEGDAYGAYAWGCNIADVEIDPITYQARCTQFTAAIDIGKAIHPILAEGQIEGGTLQGIGWALYEDVVMRDGKMQNASLTNYIIPTTLDTPPIARRDRRASVSPAGPFGAKGVGECPIDGPAAAIVNAITRRHRRAARRDSGDAGADHEGARRRRRAPMKTKLHVNGKKRTVDVAADEAAARHAARGPRPHRHQGRLRRGRVRRLHRARRRRGGQLVPGADLPGRRLRRHAPSKGSRAATQDGGAPAPLAARLPRAAAPRSAASARRA